LTIMPEAAFFRAMSERCGLTPSTAGARADPISSISGFRETSAEA
jgi:hypothetical protein